jgi:hypothetical protein
LNPFTFRELHYINRNNEFQKLPDLSISKQKKLLFLAAKKGNYGLVKTLLKQIVLNDSDLKTLAKSKNNQILGLLLLQAPDKLLLLLSNKISQVLSGIPADKFNLIFENTSEELVSGIIRQIGKEGNLELLKKMGQVDPVNALKEITFKTRNADQIQDFLKNTKRLTKKEKIRILSMLNVQYVIDSLSSDTVSELENGLDEEDLKELQALQEYALERQCQICMERERDCFFPCQNAEQYGHGACTKCFYEISSGNNPKCPWCRKTYYVDDYSY